MATANDEAWARYLAARGLALTGAPLTVAADDLKQITGREPRLLAKHDQPDEVPRCLRQQGYAVLPSRHGEYLLARGDAFCELPPIAAAEAVTGDLPFALETACRGQGEAQYIDHAHNAGLLQHFCGVAPLFLTIRGRERTGAFWFRFGGAEIAVDGVQIEVDAGYEAERELVLVEAKVGRPRHVNLRQIYYPWRHFRRLVPRKTVRPLVLTYDVATTRYELHELSFATTEDPTTWFVIRSRAYRLYGPEQNRLGDLQEAGRPTGEGLVPQADDLTRLVLLLEELDAGACTAAQVADAWGYDPRQAQYYREAAEYLGLVSRRAYELTAAGRQVLRAGPRQRRQLLARAVVNSWIVRELVADPRPIDQARIAAVIVAGGRLNPTTAHRRAKTIDAWLRWLAAEVGCFRAVPGGWVAG